MEEFYGTGKAFDARVGLVKDRLRHDREVALVALYELLIAAEAAGPMDGNEKSKASDLRLVSADFAAGLKERFELLFTEENRELIRGRGLFSAAKKLIGL